MRRREFIAIFGVAIVARTLAVHAQKPEGMRHVGVLENLAALPQPQTRIDTFLRELEQLGWIGGRNLRLGYRSAKGNVDDLRKFAEEFAALSPDVILAVTSPAVGALLTATRSVPVVFVQVIDPVGAGFVAVWHTLAVTLPVSCSSNTP